MFLIKNDLLTASAPVSVLGDLYAVFHAESYMATKDYICYEDRATEIFKNIHGYRPATH